ncbi:MAG: hypothetical protein B0D92_01885 [Spirochaeta sp. LUC14_002_19_P3]|nr:MAG: hypothetical protein B0D92_01885 [Spirochaeta sp. LUC14_002_19_P3]
MVKDNAQRDKKRREAVSVPDFESLPDNIWRMRIASINEFEYCSAPEGMSISRGDFVAVSSRYGTDLARILGPVRISDDIKVDQIHRIIRIADDEDIARREEFEDREITAFSLCRDRIREFDLPMKLIKAHYVLDGSKVVFFFTADSRIDFRELVQDLANCFRVRIELRQVGVRDSSRILGGVAVCGRPYCCHGMTDQLAPVTIKMAKEQNLSLNAQKISGACGRLFCCLAYEQDNYE